MPTTTSQVDLWRRAPSESQILEFKEAKKSFDREKLAEYCVAIANEGGGHLLLGVADAPPRPVVGSQAFPNLVDTANEVFQRVHFRVEIEAVAHPDGRVVIFSIPSRPKGTAYHLAGRYLMRSGSSLVSMSEDRLRAIFGEGALDNSSVAGRSPILDQLELSLNRSATENYWYTFDADDNRNVFRFGRVRRWSTSIFHLAPRIRSTYELTVHAVDATVFNGHTEAWEQLQDRAQTGFTGSGVARAVSKFQEENPPLIETLFRANSSRTLQIAKIGLFVGSLSTEFTLNPSRWGGREPGHYVCVYFVFHVNTRYLFFSCLLPELSASSGAPAYFLGQAEVSEENDRKFFASRAAGYLNGIASLPKSERLAIPSVIG